MAEHHEAALDGRLAALSTEQRNQLASLWGKSDAGGSPNLLIQHLLDALSIAGLMWDRYLAPNIQGRLDEISEGQGRRLLCWLAGLHDIGKATPAFQRQDEALARRVASSGLPFGAMRRNDSHGWRHDRAGAVSVRELLEREWIGAQQIEWVWPLIGGHHGHFYAIGQVGTRTMTDRTLSRVHGQDAWSEIRAVILDLVTTAAGYASVAQVEPTKVLSRPDQLALSGLIVMADWISSSTEHFIGVDDIDAVTMIGAEERAARAWEELGLRGGWGALPDPPNDPISHRFGYRPHPSQEAAVEAAHAMRAAGLMIIEAPMGEGKTETSLAVAEVLAARFGADGVFYGMPTQATADPMLGRLAPWLSSIDPGAQVALLHRKRAFNPLWQRLEQQRPSPSPTDQPELDSYGVDENLDEYDGGRDHHRLEGICVDDADGGSGARAAAEWMLGRHRGLLAANVVATIDQGLYCATQTKFVAPRYAGLAGKVVVFDEIHAADEYMTEFLVELLAWLGGGSVPVVLLSATLSRRQRERLVSAYLGGALGDPDRRPDHGSPLQGYPAVTATWVSEGAAHRQLRTSPASRPDVAIELTTLPEPDADPDDPLMVLLEPRLADGGCVLIIRNTVKRAQATFRALRLRYGDDVVLLHSRLTADHRAKMTARLVEELGSGSAARPSLRIVVATQIAEQSFDIDADLLVTDLAPIDLLLQRTGRLHRHSRPVADRPERLRAPSVIVTGFAEDGRKPTFDRGSEAIYGRHRLLRALALVHQASASGWRLPSGIATLVDQAYGDAPPVPDQWIDDEAMSRGAWDQKVAASRATARQFRLTRDGHRTAATLENLTGTVASIRDIESHINVREGDMGEEVVLVQRADLRYLTLTGIDLGANGERVRDLDATVVLGGTVRLPGHDHALNAFARRLTTLPEWLDHPWLGHAQVVVLDEHLQARLDCEGVQWRVAYDSAQGLTVERT